MLELTVSFALFVRLLLLLYLNEQLRLRQGYLECADEHVEDKIAHLDVEGAREVVPVENGGIVEEEVAGEQNAAE